VTVQFEYIFTGKGMRSRKEQRQSLIYRLTGRIQKIRETRAAWRQRR